jgi:4-carboxymuconolactone decarboxylase
MSISPRLSPIREPELDDRQRVVWDQITRGRRAPLHQGGSGLVSRSGSLIGPFNAYLHSPSVGGPAAALGEALRFDSTLDRRTLELITVVVAAHWRADFEYWAHRRYAIEAGVPTELVDEIAAGRELQDVADDDRLLVTTTRELLRTGRLGDDAYSDARRLLGASGIVDLVTLVGYYTLVSFNLNVFQVPAPVPADELWPR